MPRFVILRHDMPETAARGLHWDLMLDVGKHLATWALDGEPRLNAAIQAEQLPEHRLAYLDYEGPVSGNRGHVTRWDGGTWTPRHLADDAWEFDLKGDRLQAHASLLRDTENRQRWIVRFASPW